MDLNATPASEQAKSDESWKDRAARKVQATIDRALLEEIKASVQMIDPVLDRKRPSFVCP